MGRRKGIPGLSFSWKRATGLSAAKGKLSRQIGVPLTRSGRRKKAGKAMGCVVPVFIAVVLLSTAVGVAIAHAECSIDDFELSRPKITEPDKGYLRVTGILINHCAEPAGVQLRLVQKSATGDILNVDNFWPASTKNLAPNEEFPFAVLLEGMGGPESARFLSVVDSTHW